MSRAWRNSQRDTSDIKVQIYFILWLLEPVCFLLTGCSQFLSRDPAVFTEGQPQRMEPELNGQEPLSMTSVFFFLCFCLSVHPS